MPRNHPSRFDRILAATVVAGLAILGVGEVVTRLSEPLPLFFWLPTLWGGAVLVFLGSFRFRDRERLRVILEPPRDR